MRRTFSLGIVTAFIALCASACGGGWSAEPPQPVNPSTPQKDLAAVPSTAPAATVAKPAPSSVNYGPVEWGGAVMSPVAVNASPEGQAILAAPDRSAEDRALDPQRKPEFLIAFLDVKPGMKVADLAAGGGYTTEFLRRAVGPSGVVYGQNSPDLLQKFLDKPWSARLAREGNDKIVSSPRAFEDPLPPEARDLDLVTIVLFYHDLYWLGVDRAKMNAAIFKALKPGGVYAIVDHSAKIGSGSSEVKTVHRIEEKEVVDDITKAGFKLVAESNFLRNPADTRDWNDSPREAGARRGSSDRFVLKFQKP